MLKLKRKKRKNKRSNGFGSSGVDKIDEEWMIGGKGSHE